MELLLRWLRGDIGEHGDFPYQSMHITTVIVIAICLLLLALLAKSNISDQKKRKILNTIAIFQLSFEVIWRLIFYFVNNYSLVNLYPMYPCNLNAIIVPILCLTNNTKGKKIFYLFSFVGGIITLFVPNGIFYRTVFVFPILKSILQHTGILIIPVFEYFANYFKPSVKDFPYMMICLLITFINSGIIAPRLGLKGDFLFLDMGIPFVIEGVSQVYPMLIFTILCLFVLSIIVNIQEFISVIKKH